MTALIKRLLIFVSALLILSFSLSGCSLGSESVEDMVERTKHGVVQLYTVEYKNGNPTGIGCKGTGFAIGKVGEDSNIFITNWHVVTGGGEFADSKVYIALNNATFDDAINATNKVIPCEVLYITGGNPDFAILRATKPVSGFKALPLMSSDDIKDAAHVVAMGYPSINDLFSATSGGINDMSITQGSIVRHTIGSYDDPVFPGTKLLIFDATIAQGNSGGALVNNDGAVVGINTYGWADGAYNYSAAVYIDYAMDALDRLGIPYNVYGSFGKDAPIVILVAAVIIASAFAVYILRRKQGSAAGGTGKNEQSTSLTLLCPNGRSVPITSADIVIGRDPSQCTLTVSAETKGVSRRHCSISVVGDSILLTDLGSSYGTFVSGNRLTPNVPVSLKRGDSFYLGAATVTYWVQ